ncbi:MAG: hypothetical protein FJW95_17100 [Actinobacteria bacterium]|nr:hypothetical protein [Actinomycetota bacterium]
MARTVTGASIEPVRRDPSGRAGRTLDPDLEAAYFAGLPPPEESAAERHRRPPMHQVVPRRRRRWWFGRSAGAR